MNNIIISSSEDNYLYSWRRIKHNENKRIKCNKYEKIYPFPNANLLNSYIIPDICFNDYMAKMSTFYEKILVKNVILNTSDTGYIQVLVNYDIID